VGDLAKGERPLVKLGRLPVPAGAQATWRAFDHGA